MESSRLSSRMPCKVMSKATARFHPFTYATENGRRRLDPEWSARHSLYSATRKSADGLQQLSFSTATWSGSDLNPSLAMSSVSCSQISFSKYPAKPKSLRQLNIQGLATPGVSYEQQYCILSQTAIIMACFHHQFCHFTCPNKKIISHKVLRVRWAETIHPGSELAHGFLVTTRGWTLKRRHIVHHTPPTSNTTSKHMQPRLDRDWRGSGPGHQLGKLWLATLVQTRLGQSFKLFNILVCFSRKGTLPAAGATSQCNALRWVYYNIYIYRKNAKHSRCWIERRGKKLTPNTGHENPVKFHRISNHSTSFLTWSLCPSFCWLSVLSALALAALSELVDLRFAMRGKLHSVSQTAVIIMCPAQDMAPSMWQVGLQANNSGVNNLTETELCATTPSKIFWEHNSTRSLLWRPEGQAFVVE